MLLQHIEHDHYSAISGGGYSDKNPINSFVVLDEKSTFTSLLFFIEIVISLNH